MRTCYLIDDLRTSATEENALMQYIAIFDMLITFSLIIKTIIISIQILILNINLKKKGEEEY